MSISTYLLSVPRVTLMISVLPAAPASSAVSYSPGHPDKTSEGASPAVTNFQGVSRRHRLGAPRTLTPMGHDL